ncbi:hypothetical protein OROHE_001850 [Orobanche hederae]
MQVYPVTTLLVMCSELLRTDERGLISHRQHKQENEGEKSSVLHLRLGDGRDIKKETELLRENPLRHFPPNSLPR